jgi:hypothetical protein
VRVKVKVRVKSRVEFGLTLSGKLTNQLTIVPFNFAENSLT